MSAGPVLLWFRQDLRLGDNPALAAACATGLPVLPVFIWATAEETPWSPGGASRWWLHQSLRGLKGDLERLGQTLIIRRGNSLEVLRKIAQEVGASAVYWNRRYEPVVIQRDAQIKTALKQSGILAESFNGALLREPWTIKNQAGKPFQVFTPFWRNCLTLSQPEPPIAVPRAVRACTTTIASEALESLGLEPRIPWAEGMRGFWSPGERGAHERLQAFLKGGLARYTADRNLPAHDGTSRLSPHLHFGEISPRQVWHAVQAHAEKNRMTDWRSSQYLTEVGWREFAHHLLFHFPRTPEEPLRPDFARFPWRVDEGFLEAWQKGLTGYPIVDAGMRQLWALGWMHNRVRMIVASFLVKDLLISWREGAEWFWDTLVDADLAQNTLGWQWSAGCGADAAPYFRIFNPITQGEKFDPSGAYVRAWCPELGRLPDEWIHRPWEARKDVLERAGVVLGKTYPEPVIQHGTARNVALEAFARIKSAKA